MPISFRGDSGEARTPVNNTFSDSYTVLEFVSDTFSDSYDLLNGVNDTFSDSYDLLNSVNNTWSDEYSITSNQVKIDENIIIDVGRERIFYDYSREETSYNINYDQIIIEIA